MGCGRASTAATAIVVATAMVVVVVVAAMVVLVVVRLWVVVGDSVDDLRMGRAAGAGCVVGVTSGVSPAGLLAPFADVILPDVTGLITELYA